MTGFDKTDASNCNVTQVPSESSSAPLRTRGCVALFSASASWSDDSDSASPAAESAAAWKKSSDALTN